MSVIDGRVLSNEDKLFLTGKLVHFDDLLETPDTTMFESHFPDTKWEEES